MGYCLSHEIEGDVSVKGESLHRDKAKLKIHFTIHLNIFLKSRQC